MEVHTKASGNKKFLIFRIEDMQHGMGEYLQVDGTFVKGEWSKGVLVKKSKLPEKDWELKMTELESKPGMIKLEEEIHSSKLP